MTQGQILPPHYIYTCFLNRLASYFAGNADKRSLQVSKKKRNLKIITHKQNQLPKTLSVFRLLKDLATIRSRSNRFVE